MLIKEIGIHLSFKAALKVECLEASYLDGVLLLPMETQNIVKTVHPLLPKSKQQ